MFAPPAEAPPKGRNHKLKFTYEDDQRLAQYVAMIGEGDWNKIAKLMGDRNGRQCRERWNNYINPNLRNDAWTPDEVKLLIQKYEEFGPRWNRIAKAFNNRSTNNVKNKWLTMKRREERLHFAERAEERRAQAAAEQPKIPEIKVPLAPLTIPPLAPPPKPRLPSLMSLLSDPTRFGVFELPKLETTNIGIQY